VEKQESITFPIGEFNDIQVMLLDQQTHFAGYMPARTCTRDQTVDSAKMWSLSKMNPNLTVIGCRQVTNCENVNLVAESRQTLAQRSGVRSNTTIMSKPGVVWCVDADSHCRPTPP
jgi:hypothetical protein